jgi:hypothetical protein
VTASQIDGEPDQPALPELQAMHKQGHAAYEQAYEQGHSNFSSMVLGANKNSYVLRGGIWDVMNNKTGGVASLGGLQGSV